VDSSVTVSPPVICERLEIIVARVRGEWTQQTPEARIDYELPVHTSTEIRELFRPHASLVLAGDFIARLPGARVFGSGAVLSPDGKSIARDVSVDFGKPFQQHWLLGYQKIRPPVWIPGTTLVAATALGAGYAHWLLEELPRLLVSRGVECDTILTNRTTSFSREAWKLAGFSATLLEPRRYSHFGCEQLIVPSLIGQPGYPTRRVGRILEEFTGQIGEEAPISTGERIYLSREKARRRRVANEAELWTWLSTQGFERIFTEELTWAEQINVFRRAKVVVAPHGAGLANIVFCQRGTRIVEFFNRSYVNGCYWRLAAIQGLDYRPIVEAGAEPLAHELSANPLDINVEIAELASALASA
jgi:capsular polysaccharide biosynthesis protein